MSKGDYLNYEEVKKRGVKKGVGTVAVTAYDRVVRWVCPNPRDEQRSSTAEQHYAQGMYTSKKVYYLSEADFDDPAVWDA